MVKISTNADVVLCDMGDLGLYAKNTYESIIDALGESNVWFVLLPKNKKSSDDAKSWAAGRSGVIVVDYEKSIGGYVDRNIVLDLFQSSEWITRIAPGAIVTQEYFDYVKKIGKDSTIGAVGAIGYCIHGNWENIEGKQVFPKHFCHVLDDALWSWRSTEYRYGPPFHSMTGGHYDHQFYINTMGRNCISSPSASLLVLPTDHDIVNLTDVSIQYLAETWGDKLDFTKTFDVVHMNS